VSFDASGSIDPDGTIASYQWDFGDASTGTGMTTSHTYASATTYTVELTVQDSDGLTDEMEKIITITLQPSSLSCTLLSTQITEGDSVTTTGSISPQLSGRNVTLTYQPPSGSASSRMVTTGSDGKYSDTYTPSTLGSWMVTASWNGDATYVEASSATRVFTVSSIPEAMPCLIATATFGSELTPQVQFLRNFRDHRVLSTFAGSQFMNVFNEFYYSFSPDVADSIRESDALRDVMKVTLYPLVGVLQVSEGIFSLLSFSPEFAVVTTGFVASALIAVVYFLPLTLFISYFRKVSFLKPLFHAMSVIWLVSLTSIVIAEASQSSMLMMASTGASVLVSMGLTIVSLMIVLPSIYRKISTHVLD
jgi:peptide/nickel transport system substrate-binding protein